MHSPQKIKQGGHYISSRINGSWTYFMINTKVNEQTAYQLWQAAHNAILFLAFFAAFRPYKTAPIRHASLFLKKRGRS